MKEFNRADTYFHFDHFEEVNDFSQGNPFKIVQIGDINCVANYIGPVHLQQCHEISYIVSGSGEFVCDNVYYKVKSGDIILNRIGEEHYVKSSLHEPLRFFYIGFELTSNRGDIADIEELFSKSIIPVTPIKFGNIHSLFLNLLQEFKYLYPLKELIVNYNVNLLISTVCRNFMISDVGKEYATSEVMGSDQIVHNVAYYIEQNIYTIKNAVEVSRILGYSYPYISTVFKNDMGIGIKQYLNNQKIETAIKLMKTGKSISNVSLELNYDSIQCFSHAFKRSKGISPTEFMKLDNHDKE